MTELEDRVNRLSPVQRALLGLEEARARIAALERSRSEPIAVVGIGCRFPGGSAGPDGFWEQIMAGRSAISEVPPQRWDVDAYYDPDPDAPGKMATRSAGFLSDVDLFDAPFFGISPREAALMDPQQRLLMEVAWEALEHAGIPPERLSGSPTGVFVGISTNEYLQRALKMGDPTVVGPHAGTGNALSVAANRLSYFLGSQGPSMAIDTACSSSLVAVHLACQSLRSGESDLALAGGVNLLLVPETMINFSRARMLSPEGLCRTFDAAADGYVRGEGCGVVVLRRLSDATAAGEQVLAVIRGSAVNQDGRSNGLTAPNGPSQEAVIRSALAAAGVEPADVGYVEAHGTGTPLGDPIELRALARVLSQGRPATRPVVVGSVKTNIGHLEAAAGIAGLIKAVLALRNGAIPPHLNFSTPNPHVPWDEIPVVVPTSPRDWDAPRRVAGVSSFGFGGTNAHVVLESADPDPAPAERLPEPEAVLVKLATRGEEALAQAAGALGRFVAARPGLDLGAVAASADRGRAELPERAAVVASSAGELEASLLGLAGRQAAKGVARGRATSTRAKVAFVIPGQGARMVGAAADAYRAEPAFARAVDTLAEVLGPRNELPLAALLEAGPDSEAALGRTEVAQPALYALAWSLAQWWEAAGVTPDVVLGHSVGAYAAAAIAGVFSPAEGAALVKARGAMMGALPPGGAMAAVFADEQTVSGFLSPALSLAAVNSASEVVLSGPQDDVAAALAALAASGVATRALVVSHAFHSALMDPVLPALSAEVGRSAPRAPSLAWVSDTTARLVGEEAADPAYWVAHARRPVRFADALRTLSAEGPAAVIELGPSANMIGLARSVLGAAAPPLLASLRPGQGARRSLLEAAGAAWAGGVPLAWDRLSPSSERVSLPTYPFQRRRHWLPEPKRQLRPGAGGTGAEVDEQAGRAVPGRDGVVSGEPGRGDDDVALDGLAAPAGGGDATAGANGGGDGAADSSGGGAELAAMLLAAAPGARRPMLVNYLREAIARTIGLDGPDALDADQGLFDLGLDSMMAVELQAQLERELGRPLPATLALDHPTIAGLCDYLLEDGVLADVAAGGVSARDRGAADAGVAIVGMACRFPGGADDPVSFWRLLREGVDAIVEVPADRWDADRYFDADPAAPRKAYTRSGGFLQGAVDGFDAEFFGISGREATSMDPQQRLLLEVVWEALEDAGVAAAELAGSRTGVFVGINTADYLQLLAESDLEDVDAYVATGNTASVAAGRISYLLGLQGPAVALDTACSSSLVAAHLACQSLRSGESDLAIVAGVNLMLSPATTIGMAKLRALSPDGRCKAFDAAADGYGRGEGCGAIVLRRLPDAVAEADRPWAVIRGSSVNQDGRSAGLTVPNGPSQQALIEEALAAAGVEAHTIDYVEAHGTGTALGDPIELQALGAVMGKDRDPHRPLVVGSVKTNIGHLEAAAGIAGLIKVALSLHHREIPPHLHFREPSPYVAWDELPLVIPTEAMPWPAGGGAARAAVSSFGFSGTNAHVVLEAAPGTGLAESPGAPKADGTDEADGGTARCEPEPRLLLLSGRSPQGLADAVSSLGDFLGGLGDTRSHAGAAAWSEVCRSAAIRRSHHGHRLALVAGSTAEAAGALGALARSETVATARQGRAIAPDQRRLIFLYCGHGAEWAGMGRRLLSSEPVFQETVQRCDELVRGLAGWSVVAELERDAATSRLGDTEILQPVLFTLQAALTNLWRSWSVVPDAVVGHSVGEVAAAWASGALELSQALRVVVERGRLMQPSKDGGSMAALGMSPEEVETLLGAFAGVSIAAVNGPTTTVVSGDAASIDALVASVSERRAFARKLPGSRYAFHNRVQMEGPSRALAGALEGLTPGEARIPLYSTVTGRGEPGLELGASHWARGVSHPVRFWEALSTAAGAGHNVVVEVGPHPVLAGAVNQSLSGVGKGLSVLSSLRRDEDDRASILRAAGELHVLGHRLDLDALNGGARTWVRLPPTPWRHQRYWAPRTAGAERDGAQRDGAERDGAGRLGGLALLQRRFDSAGAHARRFFEADLDLERLPYLDGERLLDQPVLPVAALVDFVFAAAEQLDAGAGHEIADLVVHEVVPLVAGRPVRLQLVTGRADGDAFEIYLIGQGGDADSTLLATGCLDAHAGGNLRDDLPDAARAAFSEEGSGDRDAPDGDASPPATETELVPDAVVEAVRDGRDRAFPGEFVVSGDLAATEHVIVTPDGATATLRLQPALTASAAAHVAHPALVERAIDLLVGAGGIPAAEPFLPTAVGTVRLLRRLGPEVRARVLVRERTAERLIGDVELSDQFGRPVARIERLQLGRVEGSRLAQAMRPKLSELYYELEWLPVPRPAGTEVGASEPPAGPGTWLLVGEPGGLCAALAGLLRDRGQEVLVVGPTSLSAAGVDNPPAADPTSAAGPFAIGRIEGALDGLLAEGRPALRGVVDLLACGAPGGEPASVRELAESVELQCAVVVNLATALGKRQESAAPIWLVTRGSQPAGSGPRPLAPAQAPAWGLGKVVALEHPDLWGGAIDLDVETAEEDAASAVLDELLQPDGEDQLAYRDGVRLAARLARHAATGTAGPDTHLDPQASYLVTGGRGALGLRMARWLAERGARHLVLAGRRELPATALRDELSEGDAAAVATISSLESEGVSVSAPAVDVTDRPAMEALFDGAAAAGAPIRGVVHAAGVFELLGVADTTSQHLHEGLRAKVEGSWILHELTRDRDIDLFVLFSSAASVWGSALAGTYVAANHFLDALAHERARIGLSGLAVNWGWWEGGGMATPEVQSYFSSIGLHTLGAEMGLLALDDLLASGAVQRTVAPVDWTRFRPVFEARRHRPLLELMEAKAAPPGEGATREAAALLARLAETPADRRLHLVVEYIQDQVAGVLGDRAGGRIDPQLGFFEAGMDSLTSVELQVRLESGLGIHLAATTAFEHPNVVALARHLLDDQLDLGTGDPAGASPAGSAPAGPAIAPPGTGTASSRTGAAVAASPGSGTASRETLESMSEEELIELLARELGDGSAAPSGPDRGEAPR